MQLEVKSENQNAHCFGYHELKNQIKKDWVLAKAPVEITWKAPSTKENGRLKDKRNRNPWAVKQPGIENGSSQDDMK